MICKQIHGQTNRHIWHQASLLEKGDPTSGQSFHTNFCADDRCRGLISVLEAREQLATHSFLKGNAEHIFVTLCPGPNLTVPCTWHWNLTIFIHEIHKMIPFLFQCLGLLRNFALPGLLPKAYSLEPPQHATASCDPLHPALCAMVQNP